MKKMAKMASVAKKGWQWRNRWQWLGGSGGNRKRRSRRFEWYQLEFMSGSIDGDRASPDKSSKIAKWFFKKWQVWQRMGGGGGTGGSGRVAVVSIERADRCGSNGGG
jgi:hypothetical protein